MLNKSILENGYTDIVLEAEDGYNSNSMYQILADNARNSALIVENTIYNDFQELALIKNESSQESILAIQEAGLADFFGGLKDFFIKIGKKIKAMIEKVIVRIKSLITNKKDFVKQYKTKFLDNNLTDMKVNWRKPLNEKWEVEIADIISYGSLNKETEKYLDYSSAGNPASPMARAGGLDKDKVTGMEDRQSSSGKSTWTRGVKTSTGADNFDLADEKERLYKELLVGKFSNITPDDKFKEEAFDVLFESKSKESDAISDSVKTKIIAILENNKLISTMEKEKSNNEKTINSIVKAIDKARDAMLKTQDDARDRYVRGFTQNSQVVRAAGSLYSLAAGTAIAANKLIIQQSFAIFVKGTNFTKKNEEEELLDGLYDAAFDEAFDELDESVVIA